MNNHINEKNLTSFVGTVPAPMEMSMLGLFLGAPIQYKIDKNTGLDEVCMLVPQRSGNVQPVVVTLGRNDSVAPGARVALYHACGLDHIANGSNEPFKDFVERFSSVFNMSSKNDYISRIYEPKATVLREKLLKQYPENVKDFDAASEQFIAELAQSYNAKNSEKAAEDASKKKQITM